MLHYATQPTFAPDTPDKIFEYAYDHQNRWVRKILDLDGDATGENIVNTIFIYDGPAVSADPLAAGPSQIVLQFDKQGTTSAAAGAAAADLSHRYIWGPGVDQLLCDEQTTGHSTAGTVLWAMGDQLGSVRDVVDNSGFIRIHRVFDAYGNIVATELRNAYDQVVTAGQEGALLELFGFTARPFDTDTALQNNLHRWYDLSTGGWMSEDPLGFAAGDESLYRYVGNAPIGLVDPLGLAVVLPVGNGHPYHPDRTDTRNVSIADKIVDILLARIGISVTPFRRLRDELLNCEEFADLTEARWFARRRKEEYNEERPHSSLNYQTPSQFAADLPASAPAGRPATETRIDSFSPTNTLITPGTRNGGTSLPMPEATPVFKV